MTNLVIEPGPPIEVEVTLPAPIELEVTTVGGRGPQGPKGDTGDAGPAGPQGEIGPAGPKGDTGDTGGLGPTGLTGPQGPIGPEGPQGDEGPQGPAGADGADGEDGAPGAAGPPGPGVPVGGATGQVLAKNSVTDYDTEWVDASGVASASETAQGIAEIATQAETNAGTDDSRIVTPLKLQTRLAAYAQPLDSDLTAIAALSTTSYGRALLALADQAALVALLPSYQPLDSDLSSIAALSTTSYGRALLALADQAALVALLPSYQPLDSDLTSIAALTTTTYGRAFLALANQAALMALLSASSETAQGIIELATQAETNAGTDDARAVTPLKLQTRLAAYAQPLDSDLTAIAALSTNSFGRSLLELANGVTFQSLTANFATAKDEVLTVRTGVGRFVIPVGTWDIVAVAAMVNTVPTGATTLKIDVNKNGTTIYGTQANRPIWAASANAATVGAHSVTSVTAGDYLTVDIDDVGSTIAGKDLDVVILLQRTA